jgi:hypothetical protein
MAIVGNVQIGVVQFGAALLIVGISVAAVLVARRWAPARARWYVIGGAAWAVAVLLKVVLGAAVFGAIYLALGREATGWEEALASGALTGATETLLVWAGLRLLRADLQSADGLGFGGGFALAENTTVCVLLALEGVVVAAGMDTEIAREAAVAGVVGLAAFTLERVAALAVHVWSGMLLVDAVVRRRRAPLLWALLLKATIDAVPESSSGSIATGFYIAIGLGAALGAAAWLRSQDHSTSV